MSGTNFEGEKRPLYACPKCGKPFLTIGGSWQHQNLPKVRRGLNQKARAAEL